MSILIVEMGRLRPRRSRVPRSPGSDEAEPCLLSEHPVSEPGSAHGVLSPTQPLPRDI